MENDLTKENVSRLQPGSNFPQEAIDQSVVKQPPNSSGIPWAGGFFSPEQGGVFTMQLASVADQISPWGLNWNLRDVQLRAFWPTESYLAGAITNVAFKYAAMDWEIQSKSTAVEQACTDMLRAALGRGGAVGWSDFVENFVQDLCTQDNGAFIEVIRDPSASFKNERAPVVGIGHLDSNRCVRTGRADYPVKYIDRNGKHHKLAWYEVIPFSDFASSIERMNGIGYSAVTRVLKIAQIMRNTLIYRDEKVSGRHAKAIHVVGGVSRSELQQAKDRNKEELDNAGMTRYNDAIILASLDPEKSVSTATIELASLPDGFDFDKDMTWYMAGVALCLGVDYQEFAPLPGGNIGSASQSQILNRKTSGKGPRIFMDSITEKFRNYGVLPRGAELIFNDKNEEEELERQEIRTAAAEEAAIIVNAKIFPPEVMAKSLVRRGIFEEDDLKNTDEKWWKLAMEAAENDAKGQPVGARGGNTIGEDAKRTGAKGKPKPTSGGRLRKAMLDGIYNRKINPS